MKPVSKTSLVLWLAIGLAAGHLDTAHAQRSLNIDGSVRSAGMGSASNALFWGQGINHWGNPALLGYVRGVRYEWSKTQLVPGLADDVILSSHVVQAGGSGLGLVLSGQPFGVLGAELDYGESEGTDAAGNPTGTFSSFEKIKSWGFGASAAQLIEEVARLGGLHLPQISRFADVSIGMNFKEIDMMLGPGGEGSGSSRDWGMLVRATPIRLMSEAQTEMFRFDVAFGLSELNYNDGAATTFPSQANSFPMSHHQRRGLAVHAAVSPAVWPPMTSNGSAWGWLFEASSPLASLGFTFDRDEIREGGLATSIETSGSGIELNLANVVALRGGHYKDELGDISGATWGWALGLPVAGIAGVRYEEARVPQARDSGLDDLTRRALSVWVDAFKAWSALRGGPQ